MNQKIDMNLIKVLSKMFFAILVIAVSACNNNNDDDMQPITIDTLDTVAILEIRDILFNIPIEDDTIFTDEFYNIDFRIEIENHIIDSTFITINDNFTRVLDTNIISTKSLPLFQEWNNIAFMLRTINTETDTIVYFKTNAHRLKVVSDLSNRYINESIHEGKLQLTWPELDKNNTNRYLIERYMGNSLEYSQEIEAQDSIYLDDFYVGEEANFKISVINNEENKQEIWYYHKPCEELTYTISQHETEGYNIHVNKNKYYSNFEQYYVTVELNFNQEFLYSTTNIDDTVFHVSNTKFGEAANLGLRTLPLEYPQNVSDQDWMLYNKWISGKYGNASFIYDRIVKIDDEYLAFTLDGNIFKYHIPSNQSTESIIDENANYGFLRSTPQGDYLYAFDQNTFNSPVYFWTSDNLPVQPTHIFETNFIIPPVSDNLIAIRSVPGGGTSNKLALYNTVNGANIFTTDYDATSVGPKISSNGQNFFITNTSLKLCSYINNTFTLIWEETNWPKYYPFFDFSPVNDNICFTWDDEKIFSTRNISDYSELNSFQLEVEKIVNIDYSSRKIMGYVTDKILVFNLDSGALENEIPANLSDLFLSGNNSILIGNTIYSNRGINYNLD